MSNRKESRLTRRGFLKTAAVGAGFTALPYFVPASVLGRDGNIAASNRITMGVIGAGNMGTGNMKSFLDIPEVRFVAVCDVDDRHSKAAKNEIDKKYGSRDCVTYRDFRELIGRGDINAVCIAVPDHWHALIAVACARAGMDIYGEKPLARTIRDSRAICDAVKRYGIVWQTGSWQRSVGNFHRACELVINGCIGKVGHVEVGLPNGNPTTQARPIIPVPDYLDWDMWLGPAPWRPYRDFGRGDCHWDWRWIMDYSGGQLTDWAGHHIDIAHWGLGFDEAGPLEIEGKGEYPREGLWDAPYAYEFTCKYADGLVMRVANAGKQPKGMGTVWYGDRGWIHVDRRGLWASDPGILKEKIAPDGKHLYYSRNHHRHFIECVKSRKETIAPARIAHRSISVGLLGEIAMLTQKKLQWNPQAEQFVNDDGQGRYLGRAYRDGWHL